MSNPPTMKKLDFRWIIKKNEQECFHPRIEHSELGGYEEKR